MDDRLELVGRIGEQWWFHSVDLGDGLVTRGIATENEVLRAPGAIPSVVDKTVLDIGAWDGKYSFEAERAGAARVVALDHFVWKLDPTARKSTSEVARPMAYCQTPRGSTPASSTEADAREEGIRPPPPLSEQQGRGRRR